MQADLPFSTPAVPQTPHPLEVQELDEHSARASRSASNKQLFENNPLAHDPIVREYMEGGNALAGDMAPNLAIKHERPEHRLILYFKAQGKSNKEIAQLTGYGYQWVCQIVRQPWFRKAFVDMCEELNRDDVEQFLKGTTLDSLQVLQEIRDDPEAKDASRVAAANALLDRALGKPTQHIKTERIGSADNAQAEMSEVDRELAAVRERQRAMGIQPGGN